MSSGSLLEVSNVTVVLGSTTALSDVSIKFEPNSLNAVIGPSGSGKSTLLNVISTQVQPTAGSVVYNPGAGASTTGVGFVPQFIPNIYPLNLCVTEIVALGSPRLGFFTKKSERAKANDLLDLLGLPNLGGRLLSELSGGQRQRVMIARALMSSSNILVCDEPTSGADPFLVNDIISTLKELSRQGVTVIISTHDIDRVVPQCDYAFALHSGVLAYSGVSSGLTTDLFNSIYMNYGGR